MRKDSLDHSAESRVRSQELRREMSLSERVLWHHLRNDKLGYRFRRQVRVWPYYLDFYCGRAALCIEVDGEQHAERTAQDARRDAFLLTKGIETMRIPSLDFFDEHGVELGRWLVQIEGRCREREEERRGLPPVQEG